MKRRAFIAALGGAAAWPLVARGQQPMPVIGYLDPASPEIYVAYPTAMPAFRQGLKEAGFVEAQNLAIEYRWEGQYDRYPALLADLLARHVAVIVAFGNGTAVRAKAAAATIPVVFIIGGDPVKLGLVASFNKPSGNVTGVSFLATALETKRLELLCELLPNAGAIGVLANPTNSNSAAQLNEVQIAADALGKKLVVVKASNENDLDPAFSALVQQQVGALFVDVDNFFSSKRDRLVCVGGPPRVACHLRFTRVCHGWWADGLRDEICGSI
jgi:putative ABC transport system substrate-binding protein